MAQWLPVVKGLSRTGLVLDTTRMSCPFDLRLHYRQPAMPNVVGEVGSHDPARRALIDWLAGTEIEAPARTLNSIFGDSTTIQVPCIKIDLKPKEQ